MLWLLATAALLVGVVPDLPGPGPGDEGIAIGATRSIDLAGYTLADGEGETAIPSYSLDAGETVWLVGDADLWTAYGGPAPFLEVPDMVRLGNDGDDPRLIAPDGSLADAMSYSGGGTARMLLRDRTAAGWGDWSTPREHKVGESALDRPTFSVDALTLYASPDNSFEVLSGLVDGASQRLHLHVYELRSMELVDRLVAARQAHPALDLRVLVDDNPVGQSAEERHATADALRRIQQAGGFPVLAGNGRYDDHHLKVLVADGAVAVQSENWVPSGVPVDPSVGNRGWGAVLHDADAADWFAAWMEADREAWDARPFDLGADDPTFEAPARRAPRTGDYAPLVRPLRLEGPIEVVPLVAPDHTQDPRTDPLAALLADARRSVAAQQLDLSLRAANDLGWSSDDPLTSALAAAAGRGVGVRVQAAAPFASSDAGNQPELDWLAARGAKVAVMDRPGIATLHNKGLVIDGEVLVVGSMNGNHHSRSANREAALVIRSPEAAAWATDLFDSDWDPAEEGRDWGVPEKDLRGTPAAPWPTLLGILGVGAFLRSRR